jgi:hypothetical protein
LLIFFLALTDQNFKFPQVWKLIAVDQKTSFGFVGTIEGIYQQTNINAVNYYNANLDAPVGTFQVRITSLWT